MTNYDVLIDLLRENGMEYKWTKMFVKKLRDDENAFDMSKEEKEWAIRRGTLKVKLFNRGMAWLDTGSPSGMLQASQFVQTVQTVQGMYISCIEEIAYRRGFINKDQLQKIGEELKMTDYGKYILSIIEE